MVYGIWFGCSRGVGGWGYTMRFTRLFSCCVTARVVQDTFGGFSFAFSTIFRASARFFRFSSSSSSSSSFGVFVVARALVRVFSSGVRDLGQTEVRLEAESAAAAAAVVAIASCAAERNADADAPRLVSSLSLFLSLSGSRALFLCDNRKIDNARQLRCLTLTPTALSLSRPLPPLTFFCCL